MRVVSKVIKQESDCFKEIVPFWRHNSFRLKYVYRGKYLKEISNKLHANFNICMGACKEKNT